MAEEKENTKPLFEKEYPANAANNIPMGTVYAGPENLNVMMQPTPAMMMVYAGPNAMSGVGIPRGFQPVNSNTSTNGSPENITESTTCPTCGAVVRADIKFCSECGNLLKKQV